ncbi:homoprotocatechuate degradation operon regulator HpaR [Undibacterium terreum]|uniref:Homoprotocatechuate degradation operon regulator, HpaR n=1 Tax=Undibacterium terreum TaxID=1224302 RepID=A0A916UTA9_9BURK|nr:homoprotocatechuate degradation operon regulator HpaR [Undibacterium terreum]GGC85813.1 homoprotocatechuate degradation operon regulator, HpaR [Undibacterium terreum]
MKYQITYPNLPQRFLKARDFLMSNFRPILNHYGVTEQQWRILRVLGESGQLEPRELCELCQILSPSMAGMLARMEEMELIHRERVADDQRRVMVSLSNQGEHLMQQIGPLINKAYQNVEQACGKKIFAELHQVLEEFIALENIAIPQVELPAVSSFQQNGSAQAKKTTSSK